jgi:hypothetical protein
MKSFIYCGGKNVNMLAGYQQDSCYNSIPVHSIPSFWEGTGKTGRESPGLQRQPADQNCGKTDQYSTVFSEFTGLGISGC